MNDFLMSFLVVLGYGMIGFGLLYLCWLFVDSMYPEMPTKNERSNHHV